MGGSAHSAASFTLDAPSAVSLWWLHRQLLENYHWLVAGMDATRDTPSVNLGLRVSEEPLRKNASHKILE